MEHVDRITIIQCHAYFCRNACLLMDLCMTLYYYYNDIVTSTHHDVINYNTLRSGNTIFLTAIIFWQF